MQPALDLNQAGCLPANGLSDREIRQAFAAARVTGLDRIGAMLFNGVNCGLYPRGNL